MAWRTSPQGTLCNILNEQEVKPHKVRYYLERRDPDFKIKMAEVLCVYREGKLKADKSESTVRTLRFRERCPTYP